MRLRFVGPAGNYLEGHAARDHDEPDAERAAAALASGLYREDKRPRADISREIHELADMPSDPPEDPTAA